MEIESGSRKNTKDETKSIVDAASFAFNQAKNQDNLLSKSRSEVVYKKDQSSFPKPKVRANSILEFNSEFSPQYQPEQYHQKFQNQTQFPSQFHNQYQQQYQQSQYQHNEGYYNGNSQYNQFNLRFATKSSNAPRRARSDITYRPNDTRTELTNYSDPGPQVYNPQIFNFPRHAPVYENNHNYYPNQHQQPFLYGEARSPKPRIVASAMVDIGDNNIAQPITTAAVKPRKVALSAQLNDINNFTDQNYPDSRNDDDYYGEDNNEVGDDEVDADDDKCNYGDAGSNDNDNDRVELDELMKLSSDPKVQRKFQDLRISNKSLLTLNVTLESTIKEQSDKLATIPSFEAMVKTQQKQLEHLNKVEELINTLSTKMTEQDDEIKIIKTQIIEKSDEKEKTRITLFYDPKSLPLKSLPNIIFDRVYDDVTILFSVVTSLLYTVYIFPVIVVARTAKQLVDKSREKVQKTEAAS